MAMALCAKGYAIRGIYRNEKKRAPLAHLPIEWIKADVLDVVALDKAIEGAEVVIHLAAIISINGDPNGLVMRTNVEGPRHVVAACLKHKVRQLIHFSSIHAFKYNQHTSVVDETCAPADEKSFVYDQSKALGEDEIRKGIGQGLHAVILNPTGVIGPHDFYGSRMGTLFQDLFRGNLPALTSGGFDWVDVRDLVAATLTIIEQGKTPQQQYLLSGHWATFADIQQLCFELSGQKTPLGVLPLWLPFLGLPFIKIWQRISHTEPLFTYESLMIIKHANPNCSHQRARQDLDYHPRPLRESVADIFEWRQG